VGAMWGRDLNLASLVHGPDTGAPPRYDLFAVTVCE
jgi:hypothetical protein